MIHLFDVLHRLVDSKPMSEVEQAAAHDIITTVEGAITAAVGHPDLGRAITDAMAVADSEDQADHAAPASLEVPAQAEPPAGEQLEAEQAGATS